MFLFLPLLGLLVLLCSSTARVACVPSTRQGPTISNAGGAALSSDGRTAFVHSISTHPSIYVIPLPITAASNFQPQPYWTTTATMQFYYIAASASTSPQLLYLLDNQNARLVSLVVNTTSPATDVTLIYDWGKKDVDLINGMYYQASSHLLFFACYDHLDGAANDFIAFLDPSSSHPVLQTLYSTSFSVGVSAIAVSSTYLYFGTFTAPHPWPSIATIWRVPLTSRGSTAPIPNSTEAELLYITTGTEIDTVALGDLVYPGAFVLNADESVLYMTDIGNPDVNQASSPHAIYALWPLHSSDVPLNLTGLFEYEGTGTEVMQSPRPGARPVDAVLGGDRQQKWAVHHVQRRLLSPARYILLHQNHLIHCGPLRRRVTQLIRVYRVRAFLIAVLLRISHLQHLPVSHQPRNVHNVLRPDDYRGFERYHRPSAADDLRLQHLSRLRLLPHLQRQHHRRLRCLPRRQHLRLVAHRPARLRQPQLRGRRRPRHVNCLIRQLPGQPRWYRPVPPRHPRLRAAVVHGEHSGSGPYSRRRLSG